MKSTSGFLGRLKPSLRLSITLVLLAISAILISDMFGMVPSAANHELNSRKQLSESVAILLSGTSASSDIAALRPVLEDIRSRNASLSSVGYRDRNGKLLVTAGDHVKLWQGRAADKSTPEQVVVPIMRGGRRAGTLELVYEPLHSGWGVIPLDPALIKLLIVLSAILLAFFTMFFLRTSRYVEATGAVPDRVNSAFDTLAEGVVILDDQGEIVLSNRSFCEATSTKQDELIGARMEMLKWSMTGEGRTAPWDATLATGESVVGEMVELHYAAGKARSFMVNAAAIRGDGKDLQGVLITFDDVTELESQKQQLQVLVSSLESSKRDIQQKNTELEYLATRDPLTGCLNRRSYNAQFEQRYQQCLESGNPLSCIMVDIDHFKSVNDTFGHGVGDEVIRAVADQLKAVTRNDDIVGRYGGEEFSLILPGMDVQTAAKVAERVRQALKALDFSGIADSLTITASMGVAGLSDQPSSPVELNDFADKALYVAKQTGRDRVVVWSESKDQIVPDKEAARISISDHARYESEIHKLEDQLHELEDVAASYSEQAYKAQYYDVLTGLPNRALFFDRVTQEIERTQRLGTVTAFMLIEFDLFEKANHRFGRATADALFAELVERLVKLLRRTDSVTVMAPESSEDGMTISRFGSSEIGILLTDLRGREVVTWVAQRVFNTVQKPLEHEGEPIDVSCNIAVSVAPDDAESVEALITNADTAMSHAKLLEQQNALQFFDPEMQRASREQLKLEAEIREATQTGQWELYYQPKVAAGSCKIVGVEGLIRWNHPERGLLGPVHFIDFAEARGLIAEIGSWVIREACRQVRSWGEQGIRIPVAVNLSAVQLKDKHFADGVFRVLAEFNVEPELLQFEVTETTMVEEDAVSRNNLEVLYRGGISIAIDDFGTGYSSLGYLKALPVNTLKIDRAFITDIATDNYDREIVVSVIALAHGLNLGVVAEGVEELEQFELLRELNCDDIQGYLLSRPVPAAEMTKQLMGESLDVFKQAS